MRKPKSLAEIIAEAKWQLEEIQIYFNTVDHWNTQVRKPGEEPINPDPDGDMAEIRGALERFVARHASPVDAWKIFQMNECDWWLARTAEEATASAREHYGGADLAAEMLEDKPRELTEKELDEMMYHRREPEEAMCACGAVIDPRSENWQTNETGWEHYIGCPLGITAVPFKITFRQELARRLAKEPKPQMFASTEF